MFICIPVILTILIITLIVKLKLKRKIIDKAGVPNLFGEEMKNLLLILLLFDSSFIIRFFFDRFLEEYIEEDLMDVNYDICTNSDG